MKRHRCPSCGGFSTKQDMCKVCYEWASRKVNKGRRPSAELARNWASRWKNENEV